MTYYRRLAPIYDRLYGRMYRGLRGRSLEMLGLRESDTIVLIGVGTGLDLELLPAVKRAVGVDITPAMLARARSRARRGRDALVLADGSVLPLATACADAAVLHLVLSVAPDPRAIIEEAVRIVRPGGELTVCDHLAPARPLGWTRRLATRLASILGTRFDRELTSLLAALPVRVRTSDRAWFGCYQLALLERVTEDLP